MSRDLARRSPGFTLIELLVVIAVIALLASLAMPVMTQALHSATKAACTNQLKQIYAGYQGYINWEYCHPALEDGKPVGIDYVHNQTQLALEYMKELTMVNLF